MSRKAAYGLGGLLVLTAAVMLAPAGVVDTGPLPADRLIDGVAFWTMAIATVAFPHVLVDGYLDRRGIWATV